MIWMRMDIAGTASAAYDKGFVYLHSGTGDLSKVNASDGKTVWGPVATNDNKGCPDGTSSPIVANGKVFVGHSCGAVEVSGGDYAAAKGGVEAFDAATGMRAWTYLTAEGMEDGAMVWSTVSVDLTANVVFAGSGNNYTVLGANSDAIHAIDIATGKVKWKKQVHTDDRWSLLMFPGGPDSDFGANPVLFELNGRKVVANGDKGGSYHMFDRETGEIIWQRTKLSTSANQANGGVLMNGAYDGKYLYAVSNQPPNAAQLHAMDPDNMGMDVWPPKMFTATSWGAPSLANGVLVVPNDDKLYVYNAMTGEQLAMFMTGGTIAAGAASIADGNIIVQSGLEYILDSAAKSGKQVICYSVP
jgi:outer membrane protein assembly factor BamB